VTALAEHVARPLADLAGGGPVPAQSGPFWLARARHDAARWIEVHGFPTKKHEDWRYLPLDPVLAEAFEVGGSEPAPAAAAWAKETVERCSIGRLGSRLVFLNGRFVPHLSRITALPHGVVVSNLGPALTAEAAHARAATLRRAREPRHAFAALNIALAADGALVEVPAGVVLDEAIELVYLTDPAGRALLTSPRSLLYFGKESQATIVETHCGAAGARYCTNAVTHVLLDAGAAVEHYRLQDESDHAFHFSSLDVRQAAGSHFRSHLVALGAEIARHEVEVLLGGEGAALDLGALYLPQGTQHHDHPVLVEHAAPGCTSRQRYVGIVDDCAHGVFNGHVIVRPGAAGTDASQSNKNLLLSERAEVDTRPRLEIFTDDVACAHGAAVGRLDADALFYLRSRGVPEPRARGILVRGFAAQALECLTLAPLRARAEGLIAGRLGLENDAVPVPVLGGSPVPGARR